jgi:hypothetical protein
MGRCPKDEPNGVDPTVLLHLFRTDSRSVQGFRAGAFAASGCNGGTGFEPFGIDAVAA